MHSRPFETDLTHLVRVVCQATLHTKGNHGFRRVRPRAASRPIEVAAEDRSLVTPGRRPALGGGRFAIPLVLSSARSSATVACEGHNKPISTTSPPGGVFGDVLSTVSVGPSC